ncbi:hypothetical protein GWI33_016406 [Rhynchophorus ferrugineus]|uniref:Uncharacterized protein n=1 Tax=Rhynchophorus ferrugineus TaxID=354439 RepID=A0A834HYR6_RHYFE|nr:hypothetical protein GWI33_016406 [Rhynchophorus ferrugineus]
MRHNHQRFDQESAVITPGPTKNKTDRPVRDGLHRPSSTVALPVDLNAIMHRMATEHHCGFIGLLSRLKICPGIRFIVTEKRHKSRNGEINQNEHV